MCLTREIASFGNLTENVLTSPYYASAVVCMLASVALVLDSPYTLLRIRNQTAATDLEMVAYDLDMRRAFERFL
jgi:hypothetical protein